MNLLYYIDRMTQWLDFSWLISKPRKNIKVLIPNNNELPLYEHPPEYIK